MWCQLFHPFTKVTIALFLPLFLHACPAVLGVRSLLAFGHSSANLRNRGQCQQQGSNPVLELLVLGCFQPQCSSLRPLPRCCAALGEFTSPHQEQRPWAEWLLWLLSLCLTILKLTDFCVNLDQDGSCVYGYLAIKWLRGKRLGKTKQRVMPVFV